MLKRVSLFVFAFTLFAFATSLRAADDPLVGTWKLNLAKSKYNGIPAPKSQVYKYEANGPDGVKFTNDTAEADGTKTHAEYAVKFDGKDVPVKGDPNRDMTSNKRVDSNTTSIISKLGGKVASTSTRVVSKDGKTLTISSKGTRNGKPYDNVAIYDKQ
jgi:hypothetical protein